MSLINEYSTTGNLLFRYRSFFPIILIPFIFYFITIELAYIGNLLYLSVFISYMGEVIRIYTIAFIPPATSGRNTDEQYATCLNKTGIYSTVRHPLYLGNYIILLGPVIYTNNLYAVAIYSLMFWIYYERIMFAEEAYLESRFGEEFANWAKKIPAFIPSLKLYVPAKGKFSFIQVIEREYTGFCGIIFIYFIIEAFKSYLLNNSIFLSFKWNLSLFIATLIYLAARMIKKRRRL